MHHEMIMGYRIITSTKNIALYLRMNDLFNIVSTLQDLKSKKCESFKRN